MFRFIQSLIDKIRNKEDDQTTIASQENQENHEDCHNYIEEKKKIYDNLMKFLEDDEGNTSNFKLLINEISQQQQDDPDETLDKFLDLIISIADNIHRNESVFDKIYQIIEHYESQIKQTMSNMEIFNKFSQNKKRNHNN